MCAGIVPFAEYLRYIHATLIHTFSCAGATPLALEASEFFSPDPASGESGHLFWKYAEALPAGTIGMSDKAQYEAALAAATPLLSAGQLDLLKYALAIRQFSPMLQAHRELWQMAEGLGCRIASTAAAVAIVNGKDCVTDPGEPFKTAIKSALAAAKSASSTADAGMHDLGHEYKSANATAEGAGVVVHLYASLGSDTFIAFHKALSRRAEKGKIRYIVRHTWPVRADVPGSETKPEPMLVQGYGVEMAIKNMEYKAVDDQKKEGGASAQYDDEDEEDEVSGFDFKVLLQRKPEREVELLSLRDALQSEALKAESTDIKVWALKDLGVQASQRILQSEEPLRLIRDLSHNLPALVGSISRMRVNATIREELEANRNYMHPGTNMIFVNGRQLQLDSLTPYNLYEFVKHETKMMDSMHALGLDTRSSRKILNAPSAGGGGGGGGMGGGEDEASSFKLDINDDAHVFWVNDIEKDDMYKQWPRSLQALLQRGWPGQLKYVQRNLWTAIYMIDTSNLEDFEFLSEALNQVHQQLPVRFGFIFKSSVVSSEPPPPPSPADAPKSSEESESTTQSLDDGVAFYRLFRALYERHGNKAAFDFGDGYFRRAAGVGKEERRAVLKDIFKATAKRHRSDKGRAKFGRDLKSAAADAFLRKSTAFAMNSGVGMQGPACVVNGVVLEGMALDEQNLHYLLQSQMVELQRMTYFGQMDEQSDIYTQFVNHGGPAHKRFHKLIVPGTHLRAPTRSMTNCPYLVHSSDTPSK